MPQTGSISGFAVDVDAAAIPGATVTADSDLPSDHLTTMADQTGHFTLTPVRPAVPYRVTIAAPGFKAQVFTQQIIMPGQAEDLSGIALTPGLQTTVEAKTSQQIAVTEVKEEEQQRLFGIIPNFYVVYDGETAALPASLKYKLALRSATDVVALAGAVFIAGIDQAADTPAYVQGAKGFGQRVGANYIDAASDVIIGGAVLPALLHQDPRYFYQGTGTRRSRVLHALESPFLCRGDNGSTQVNYSSIGGDLISGALTNVYYPPTDRGPHLVFTSAAITTAGRMANALAQEFLFSRLTTRAKTP